LQTVANIAMSVWPSDRPPLRVGIASNDASQHHEFISDGQPQICAAIPMGSPERGRPMTVEQSWTLVKFAGPDLTWPTIWGWMSDRPEPGGNIILQYVTFNEIQLIYNNIIWHADIIFIIEPWNTILMPSHLTDRNTSRDQFVSGIKTWLLRKPTNSRRLWELPLGLIGALQILHTIDWLINAIKSKTLANYNKPTRSRIQTE